MNELRRKKIESRILRAVSELIQKRRIKDERIGFVSVTRVKLLDDLSVCTLYISLFDADDRSNHATRRALDQAAPSFQSTIAREMRLRETPRFVFEIDQSSKDGDAMLDKLMDGEGRPRTVPEGD